MPRQPTPSYKLSFPLFHTFALGTVRGSDRNPSRVLHSTPDMIDLIFSHYRLMVPDPAFAVGDVSLATEGVPVVEPSGYTCHLNGSQFAAFGPVMKQDTCSMRLRITRTTLASPWRCYCGLIGAEQDLLDGAGADWDEPGASSFLLWGGTDGDVYEGKGLGGDGEWLAGGVITDDDCVLPSYIVDPGQAVDISLQMSNGTLRFEKNGIPCEWMWEGGTQESGVRFVVATNPPAQCSVEAVEWTCASTHLIKEM